ncbi:MAG: MFS transporter, partial [Bacillota bacterium]
ISDRMGRLQCLRLIFLVMCLATLAFPYLGSALTLLIAAGTVGLGFGGILSLFPALTADYFGAKNVGANYGLLFTAYGIAGVVGPSLGARIYDATGSYYAAFIIMACLCLVAVGISVLTKPPKRQT